MLGETIREKLLEKINLMGDPYSELKRLFSEIDSDNSNKLSRLEFETLMDMLHINFSRNKWKQIYHEIDRNYDDQVSFEEFILFLFPNHDIAKAMEVKRMKIIRTRLADRVSKQTGKNYFLQQQQQQQQQEQEQEQQQHHKLDQVQEQDDDSVEGGRENQVVPMPIAISSSAIEMADEEHRYSSKHSSKSSKKYKVEELETPKNANSKGVTFAENNVEHILSSDSELH